MEIKLKKPSQESINKAFLEILHQSNLLDFELNYEYLKNQENIVLRLELLSKSILDRAEVIENFGQCNVYYHQAGEPIVKGLDVNCSKLNKPTQQ